jgi:hypothetical protein
VTVTGTHNGVNVSATANATVTLTPAPVVKPAAVVAPVAALHGPSGCVEAKSVKVYVTGSDIKSVSYSLDGRHLGTATKRDPSGRYVLTINTAKLSLREHHLVAVVTYDGGKKTKTLRSDLVRCQPPRLPLFTG